MSVLGGNSEIPEVMKTLVGYIYAGWPNHWEQEIDDLDQTAASFILQYIIQSSGIGKDTHLWDKWNDTNCVEYCLSLMKALPKSVNRVPVLIDLAKSKEDRIIMADLLEKREITIEEMSDQHLMSVLKKLRSLSDTDDDLTAKKRLDEVFRIREVEY